jgi:hypothetical protein
MRMLISHRGNIKGPIEKMENRPSYIDCAIGLGFNVEIDLRINNGAPFLGHDFPQYEINKNWILRRKDVLWIHCKDLESVDFISGIDGVTFFCHNDDPFVLINNGNLWVHDLSLANSNSIIPLIGKSNSLMADEYKDVLGICSDYVWDIDKNN